MISRALKALLCPLPAAQAHLQSPLFSHPLHCCLCSLPLLTSRSHAVAGHLDVSQAQAPFAVAYDHLCHLQSLFKAQAHALRIAYANLAYHLDPIVNAFRDFSERAEGQLDQQEKLLAGYQVDMAMLPKVIVHEQLFRRRDKDGADRRKSLVDWIHTKKMEEVRNHCQMAHCELAAATAQIRVDTQPTTSTDTTPCSARWTSWQSSQTPTGSRLSTAS